MDRLVTDSAVDNWLSTSVKTSRCRNSKLFVESGLKFVLSFSSNRPAVLKTRSLADDETGTHRTPTRILCVWYATLRAVAASHNSPTSSDWIYCDLHSLKGRWEQIPMGIGGIIPIPMEVDSHSRPFPFPFSPVIPIPMGFPWDSHWEWDSRVHLYWRLSVVCTLSAAAALWHGVVMTRRLLSTIARLGHRINDIGHWMTAKRLQMNPAKTELLRCIALSKFVPDYRHILYRLAPTCCSEIFILRVTHIHY